MTTRVCLRSTKNLSHLPTILLTSGESRTIGRSDDADIIIDEPRLSRRHARLTLRSDGTVSVEDLGSMNGIFVNGVRQQEATLAIGDRVDFASVEYSLESAPAPAPSAVRPSATDQTIVRLPLTERVVQAVDRVALEALLATSRELMACGDLNGLLNRVLDRMQTILEPDRSAILLFDAATGELKPRMVRPPGAYTSVSDFASSTAVREAIAAREALVALDTRLDARLLGAESIVAAGVTATICVPLLGRHGPIGALYADQRSRKHQFTPAQTQYAAAFAAHVAAALETAQLYEDRERHFRATLEAFARAIDARDRYTAGHSERVTAYTLALARVCDLPDRELEILRRAGMLHDIGKVGVPDHVLLKPGALDPAERALMEAHVTIGFNMLVPLPFLEESLPSIRGHHERWDGRGYPDRLGGDEIHRHARLMAVADSYDAMTSARPYRNALPFEEAARRLRKDSGQQFDPAAVEAFDAVEAEFRAIRDRAIRKHTELQSS
jgi:putative nucleotidyltransferase with HDIG domain